MNFIDDAESARSNDDNGTVATEDTITPLQRRLHRRKAATRKLDIRIADKSASVELDTATARSAE